MNIGTVSSPPSLSLESDLQELRPPATSKSFQGQVGYIVEPFQNRISWCVHDTSIHNARDEVSLRQGDIVTLRDTKEEIVFAGTIDPVFHLFNAPCVTAPVTRTPNLSERCSIAWTQKGWDPYSWAEIFVKGSLSAEVSRMQTTVFNNHL